VLSVKLLANTTLRRDQYPQSEKVRLLVVSCCLQVLTAQATIRGTKRHDKKETIGTLWQGYWKQLEARDFTFLSTHRPWDQLWFLALLSESVSFVHLASCFLDLSTLLILHDSRNMCSAEGLCQMKNGRASRIGDFLIFFDLDIYPFTKLTSRTAIKAMDSMVILCSPYLRMCWGILPHEQSGTERNWNCWKVFWCLPIPSLCLCAILSNWLNDLTFPVHGFVHTIIQISYIYIYYNGWCLLKTMFFKYVTFWHQHERDMIRYDM